MIRLAAATVVIHLVLNGFITKAVSTALSDTAKASLYNYYTVIRNGLLTNYDIITGWL